MGEDLFFKVCMDYKDKTITLLLEIHPYIFLGIFYFNASL